MFSADITWAPLAEDSASTKKERGEAGKDKDADSLESKNSRSSTRFRWPFSKKSNSGEFSTNSPRTKSLADVPAQDGLILSSEVELPGTSISSSQLYSNRGQEYYPVQESPTHQQPLASPTKHRGQNENQKENLGALAAVQELFELPASTTTSNSRVRKEPQDQSLVLKDICVHHRPPSSITSSSTIANSPPNSYHRLSPSHQFAQIEGSPNKQPPALEKTYPR